MRWLRRLVQLVEVAQVQWLGASALSVAFRTPVLVLHTAGRRTGRRRSTVLAVHEDPDGSLLVVGGAGGQARTPDWVANLRAHPAAEVSYRRRQCPVVAEELAGEERDEAWRRLAAVWPQIERYQRRAGRRVPIVRLATGAGPVPTRLRPARTGARPPRRAGPWPGR